MNSHKRLKMADYDAFKTCKAQRYQKQATLAENETEAAKRREDYMKEAKYIEEAGKVVWQKSDPVAHPAHYNQHPSGVECIEITQYMDFCLGNAMKYLWRYGLKNGESVEDLKKAAWYINRKIELMGG